MQSTASIRDRQTMSALSAPWPSYGLFLKVERARVTYLRKRIKIALANLRARKFRSILDATVRRLPYLYRPLVSHPSARRSRTSSRATFVTGSGRTRTRITRSTSR